MSFSFTEKLVFAIFACVFIVSAIVVLVRVNNNLLVQIPETGGTLREGVVGTPRFINPVIAVSAADKDLTALLYSGLTKKTADGTFVPDLAERYEISDDALSYRFFIRPDAIFHDGTPVTTDDIIFTVLKVQDPETGSAKRSEWEGITMEKISATEMVFRLKQPYEPFMSNTTLGILPRHLWEGIPTGGFELSKYNTEPIGSGPYALETIKRDSANIPESYTLSAFKHYALGKPFINTVVFRFVKNETDLVNLYMNGEISALGGIRPEVAKTLELQNVAVSTEPLPRIFGLFFNQNEARILADSAVRRALTTAIDKEYVVNELLSGYAEIADDSIPPELEYTDTISETNSTSTIMTAEERIVEAQTILERNGWEKNEAGVYIKETKEQKSILTLSIATNNIPELVAIAEYVVDTWKSVGIDASVKIFEPGDLNQIVIRPRNFEVLLFGMAIQRYPDLYAFWHSSQRLDPGLNITNYANISADKELERLKTLSDPAEIQSAVALLNENITADRPAIFLYTPQFIYVLPETVQGVRFANIVGGEDRFMNIHEWFIETDKVWKIFN